MKRDWVEKAQDWLAMGLNHLLFIAGAITVMDLFQADNSMLWLWIALFLIPASYYLFIKRPQKALLPPLFVVLLGIFSLTETIMDKHDWSMYYVVFLFLYLIGYFLYYFLNQYTKFLILNKTSAANISEEDMVEKGMMQTILFSIGCSLILLMSVNVEWFAKVADIIWNWILSVLRGIFSRIHTEPPVQQEQTVEEIQQNLAEAGTAIEHPFFPEFLQNLAQNIARIFVVFALIGGCIVCLLLIYELIKRYFVPQERNADNRELQTSKDIREYCGVEKKKSQKKSRFVFGDNRKKIRKIYQKRVLQHKVELIGEQEEKQLRYLTAKECCERISEEHLKRLYEKARYSEENISEEDRKDLKRILWNSWEKN